MKIVFNCITTSIRDEAHAVHVMSRWASMGRVFRQAGHETVYVAREGQPGPRLAGARYLPREALDEALERAACLFMWNGLLADQRSAAERAAFAGVRVIRAELGWLPQHKTCFFDPRGVGADCTLADWVFETSLNEAQAGELLERLARYHEFMRTWGGHDTPDADVTPPYALIPLQVEQDSSIVVYGGGIRNMQQVIDRAREIRPRARLVYKLHPKAARTRADYRWPAGAAVATRGLHELLAGCDEVITVNSTVGLEALAYRKPVTVLGRAFWAHAAGESPAARRDAFLYEVFRRQWCEDWLETDRILKLLRGEVHP